MPKWVRPVAAFAAAGILLASGALAEPPPSVSECDLCLGVAEEYPYACLESVSAITTNEESIYVRIRLEGPFYEAHEVTARWIDPCGELYYEEIVSILSPSSRGYGWWNDYVAWSWIDVAGRPASEMLGSWLVKVLVDGEERCSKTFTIDLSQETMEAISASVRECVDFDDPNHPGLVWDLVLIEMDVGPEAAGFHYEILYDTEESGGTFAGQEIGLGPNAQSLGLGGELDESGAASIEIPLSGDEETLFFQALIATSPSALAAGSFSQSNVVRVDRPSEEEPIAPESEMWGSCAIGTRSVSYPEGIRLYYDCTGGHDTAVRAVNFGDAPAILRITAVSSDGSVLCKNYGAVGPNESREYSIRTLVTEEGGSLEAARGLCIIDELRGGMPLFRVERYYGDGLYHIDPVIPGFISEDGEEGLQLPYLDSVVFRRFLGGADALDSAIAVVNCSNSSRSYVVRVCDPSASPSAEKTIEVPPYGCGDFRLGDLLQEAGLDVAPGAIPEHFAFELRPLGREADTDESGLGEYSDNIIEIHYSAGQPFDVEALLWLHHPSESGITWNIEQWYRVDL